MPIRNMSTQPRELFPAGTVTVMRLDILSMNDSRPAVQTQSRPLWQVGAILEATAVRDVASGQLWLQIGQQRLPARLASNHNPGPLEGEKLKLKITGTTPLLAMETVDAAESSDSNLEALRRFLPRQVSPAPLLANLGWLMRSPEQLQSLPKPIQQGILQLWQTLPDFHVLQDAEQIQLALQHSGTFLESLLAGQNPNELRQDYKANLLQLKQLLNGMQLEAVHAYLPPGPLPSLTATLTAMNTGPASMAMLDVTAEKLSELQQQVEGNLARINSNQLLNDQITQQGLLSWLIELPFLRNSHPELLRLKISRDSGNANNVSAMWRLEMALDLGSAGQLHALILLQGKNLNIQLRSESATLVNQLNQSLKKLTSALKRVGLVISRIVCLHGAPVDPEGSPLNHLLDLQA